MRNVAKLLALVAGLSAVPLAGQAPDTIDVRGAIDAVRDRGSVSRVAELLSRERGNLSQSALDAIAGDLVSLAISFDGSGSLREQGAATSALTALVSSASAGRTTPYPRAFESIRRIYEGSQEPGIRAAALLAMTLLPNTGRTVRYMTGVATSNDLEAVAAIRHLGFGLGAPGVAALKRLYEAGTVVVRQAQMHLQAFAGSKGW